MAKPSEKKALGGWDKFRQSLPGEPLVLRPSTLSTEPVPYHLQ